MLPCDRCSQQQGCIQELVLVGSVENHPEIVVLGPAPSMHLPAVQYMGIWVVKKLGGERPTGRAGPLTRSLEAMATIGSGCHSSGTRQSSEPMKPEAHGFC